MERKKKGREKLSDLGPTVKPAAAGGGKKRLKLEPKKKNQRSRFSERRNCQRQYESWEIKREGLRGGNRSITKKPGKLRWEKGGKTTTRAPYLTEGGI